MVYLDNSTEKQKVMIPRVTVSFDNFTPIGGNDTTVDLNDYYTKAEVNELIDNVEVDLTGYATEDWVKDEIAKIEGGGDITIDYPHHLYTIPFDSQEAYDFFNKGEMVVIHFKDIDSYGMVTDVSNRGRIRLNGLIGDRSGDAKPLRFECNGSNYATWKMAFNEDIERIDMEIDDIRNNMGGGGSSDSDEIYVYNQGTTNGIFYLDANVVEQCLTNVTPLFYFMSNNDSTSNVVNTRLIPLNIERDKTSSTSALIRYYVWGMTDENNIIYWEFGDGDTAVSAKYKNRVMTYNINPENSFTNGTLKQIIADIKNGTEVFVTVDDKNFLRLENYYDYMEGTERMVGFRAEGVDAGDFNWGYSIVAGNWYGEYDDDEAIARMDYGRFSFNNLTYRDIMTGDGRLDVNSIISAWQLKDFYLPRVVVNSSNSNNPIPFQLHAPASISYDSANDVYKLTVSTDGSMYVWDTSSPVDADGFITPSKRTFI